MLLGGGALRLGETVAERASFALEELAVVFVFASELGEPVVQASFELIDALSLGCEQPGQFVSQKHAKRDECKERKRRRRSGDDQHVGAGDQAERNRNQLQDWQAHGVRVPGSTRDR